MINIASFDISQLDEKGYQYLLSHASPSRQSKAERYLRQEDKVRCVAADALLRYAVEQSLGVTDFTVAQDSFGKPYLPNQKGFHYNISHSGRYVVIAYGDSPVGIDVQQMRLDTQKNYLARRCFTPAEQDYVFESDGSCSEDRFFQVWTAKESYLKYLGIGLRKPLNSFSVVPDGRELGVRLDSSFSDGYCMTLCTDDRQTAVTYLHPHHLIKNFE